MVLRVQIAPSRVGLPIVVRHVNAECPIIGIIYLKGMNLAVDAEH